MLLKGNDKYPKIKVYYSYNVHWPLLRMLSNKFGVVETQILERYVDVPLLHDRVSNSTYSYVVNNI